MMKTDLGVMKSIFMNVKMELVESLVVSNVKLVQSVKSVKMKINKNKLRRFP